MTCNSFNEKVWNSTKKIPEGKISTYKLIAEKLGVKSYRAVGRALRCNPYSPAVPCHRIVKSDGSIGGFKGSSNPNSKEIKEKIKLLEKEGIRIKNNIIVDFENVVFRF